MTGRYYGEFTVGDLYRSRLGRTVLDSDNTWFTCLTLNTNQVHFNAEVALRSPYGKTLVNSCLTLSLVTGLTVPDTSENAIANLGWRDVLLPAPVFIGDTLWAETEVIDKRQSKSRPGTGIVHVRSRGINQRREVVIEFSRAFLVPISPEAATQFPGTAEGWRR